MLIPVSPVHNRIIPSSADPLTLDLKEGERKWTIPSYKAAFTESIYKKLSQEAKDDYRTELASRKVAPMPLSKRKVGMAAQANITSGWNMMRNIVSLSYLVRLKLDLMYNTSRLRGYMIGLGTRSSCSPPSPATTRTHGQRSSSPRVPKSSSRRHSSLLHPSWHIRSKLGL